MIPRSAFPRRLMAGVALVGLALAGSASALAQESTAQEGWQEEAAARERALVERAQEQARRAILERALVERARGAGRLQDGIRGALAPWAPGMMRSGGMSAERILAHADELELTDEQTERVRSAQRQDRRAAIERDAAIEVAELDLQELLADEPAADLSAVEAKMMDIARMRVQARMAELQLRRELEGILTAEQSDKLEDLGPHMFFRARSGGPSFLFRRDGPGGDGPGGVLRERERGGEHGSGPGGEYSFRLEDDPFGLDVFDFAFEPDGFELEIFGDGDFRFLADPDVWIEELEPLELEIWGRPGEQTEKPKGDTKQRSG